MFVNWETGVARDHCLTCQVAEETTAEHLREGLHPEDHLAMEARNPAVTVESAVTHSLRMMERSETSATGSVVGHCPHFPNRSAKPALEKGVVAAQLMGHAQKGSRIGERRQQHGERAVLRTLRMARDLQDATFRSDRLLTGLQPRQSRIANGVQR